MNIRMLEQRELLSAMHLVWDVFVENTAPLYSSEGVAEFQKFIKIEQITDLYNRREMFFWGAFEGDELQGVSAMYKSGHISLLDVRTAYQNQGIGRALFETMKQFCAQSLGLMRMTVNSAPNAVERYRSFGFQVNAHEQIQNGIRYVPMDFLISPADVRRPNKKSQTGLVIGITVVVVVILIIAAVLFYRSVMNVISNQRIQNQWEENYDNSWDDSYGDDSYDYGDEAENSGIESIPAYEAADLSYTIESNEYYEDNDGSSAQMCMDVEYPQIDGLDSKQSDKINQILKECAMETADALYLNPTDEVKGYLLEQESVYIGSKVRYKVTYLSEDIISVVFEDHYFWGSRYAEFCDLRTRTINLKDGTIYEIKDIVTLDDDFMDAWYTSMKEEAPDIEVTDLLSLDTFKQVFEGEFVENRYSNAFFLKDGGLEIGLSYHHGDDGQIARGWMTAPFTWDEIAPYKTDNGMWKIVKSND